MFVSLYCLRIAKKLMVLQLSWVLVAVCSVLAHENHKSCISNETLVGFQSLGSDSRANMWVQRQTHHSFAGVFFGRRGDVLFL